MSFFKAKCLCNLIYHYFMRLIGWTPLVELKNIMKKDGIDARIIGKLEYYHPLSSVKDRSALRMIEDAEEKGLITPGLTTLIETTSGNLGIGLAYIALQKGYKYIAVFPDHYSIEKQMILKYLGADVILRDMSQGIQDPEIWKDTAGKADIFLCGTGTGGTLTGAGRYPRMKNPDLKIIAVEPAESPVISGGNPGKHNIQGIGVGIIPDNLDTSLINAVITVMTEEAMISARRLAREEGLLAGISSGIAALKVARKAENKDKMIVTIFPSAGERYISTELVALAREEYSKMTI